MTIMNIPLDEALDLSALSAKGFSYVWYQEISRANICRIGDYQPDRAHLLEARIFTAADDQNNAREIHIFAAQDGNLKAVLTVTQGADPHRDEDEILLPPYGKSLTVRTVYDYEADGQAYPAVSLLVGYEGAEVS